MTRVDLHSAAMRRALALLSAAVLVLAGCGGAKKTQADFVKANAALIRTVPLYPKAKLRTSASTGYSAGRSTVIGYQTRYIYALPRGATVAAVEAFYLKSLQSWKQESSLAGPILNYRKSDSFVSINLAEVKKLHLLEIVVDDSFYSHLPKSNG